MLIELSITDFAVVKQLNLDFANGMTVITGETGAGKSILLDALGLALGERADSQWIRPGCEKADISARFDISHLPCAVLWLTDSELLMQDQDNTCLIRRVLDKNGRSKAFINGKPATTTQLRMLGEYLVQIHGQHQHQLLLKPFEQLRLLDAFGQHDNLLSEVAKAYEQCAQIEKKIEQVKANADQDPSKLSLLEYQAQELEQLNFCENEWQSLNEEQKKLSNASEDLNNLHEALDILSTQDQSAITLLQQALHALGPLQHRHAEISSILELLKTAHIHMDEAGNDLHHLLDNIDLNPNRLDQVESRISQIFDIARKHRVEVRELARHQQRIQHELDCLQDADQHLARLEQDLIAAKKSYDLVAKKLSKARQKASQQMAKEIEAWLAPLGIKGGQFEIALKPNSKYSAYGLESAQFLVSTNPGHPVQVMQKIVSGGELSRISLAVQLITASYQNTPTLIFDEVDVGVGGKVGAIIGKALHELAQNVQVFCITHLPQVAAFGDHHFQVSKSHHNKSTTTNIDQLDAKQRVEEIARMLGGLDITKQARDNAKALLKRKKTLEATC